MTDATSPRRTRGEAVAVARYQRRLNAAGEDPGAQFMAHVDRIRALKNVLLTLTAASLLADLIERAARPQAEFTSLDFREFHGQRNQSGPVTCTSDQNPGRQ